MIKFSSQEEEELRTLALLAALKSQKALASLLYKINPIMNSWLMKWIQNYEDRKDIRQNISAKLFLALEDGQYNGGLFSAWLYRMVQSEAIDFLRQCKMKFSDAEPWNYIADAGTTAATALEELCRKAEAAVEKLPPAQRSVFKLRVLTEKSFAEIGKARGGRSASDMSSVYKKARHSARVSMLGADKTRELELREKKFRSEDAKRGVAASI